MKMLYDSESFVVVQMQAQSLVATQDSAGLVGARQEGLHLLALERRGFEIVDKRSGKEVYLDGSWAELFQRHILAWQQNTPTQEEVELTLGQYAELAQNPVVMH
ncbi:MAG: DUF3567 domain-containing protein [Betaproteobacteria bacterium]